MSGRKTAVLVVAEGAGAALLCGVGWLATGQVSLVLTALGAFLGAFVLFWVKLGGDPRWIHRPALRGLAVRSALAGWAAGTLVYGASWSARPELYDFGLSGLLVAAPVVGLMGAFLGLVAPLCAADGAGTLVGGLHDGGELRRQRAPPPTSSRLQGGGRRPSG